MSVTAASVKSKSNTATVVPDEAQTVVTGSNSNETKTVYQNQRVIDAQDDGLTYKDTATVRSRSGSLLGSVLSYDAALEKKKLTDSDKNKATVAEIYPWIIEEAEPKRKITNLAQLVKDTNRKGLSQRHNLILDLTDEVRTLRAEVEDVLFYDNEETLQQVLDKLWEEHHLLIQRFEEFMSDLTVDSPLPTPPRSPTPVPTPEHVRKDRANRRMEDRFKSFFSGPKVDEAAADKEFSKSCKPNKFGM